MIGLLIFLSVIVTIVAAGYKSIKETIPMPYKSSDLGVAVYTKSLDSRGPRIYVVGGCISDQLCTDVNYSCYCPLITNNCMYFTPESPAWHNCKPAPTPRYRHTATIVGDYLYVIGGRHATSSNATISDQVINNIEVYDIINNNWSTFATQSSTQSVSNGAAFTYGNKFYVVGGYSGPYYTVMNEMIAYDTTASMTSFTGSPTTMAPMAMIRGDIGMTQLGNYVYVTGGFGGNSANSGAIWWCVPQDIVERYDMSTDSWTTMSPMLYRRGSMVTANLGGYMFSIGGEEKLNGTGCGATGNGRSVPISYVGKYDTSKNTWGVEEQLSVPVFRFNGASYESKSQKSIFLFGGQLTYNPNLGPYGGYALTDEVYQYVPYSVADKSNALTAGEIAAIVISILAFFTCCFAVATFYLLRQRYYS